MIGHVLSAPCPNTGAVLLALLLLFALVAVLSLVAARSGD